jgi:hypothetical protein
VQANYMCRQMREHVDIPDTLEILSKLGAHGCAVVVAGGDVARDPSPLPVREGAVYLVSHQQVMGLPEHQIRLSKGLTAKFVLLNELWAAKSRLAWIGGRLGCCP